MFLRKLFFSPPELKQPIIDDKEKLLADLTKEISWKRKILLKGTLYSLILAGGVVGSYFLIRKSISMHDYLEDQKDPKTWDKPCGNIVASLSYDTIGYYNTEECFEDMITRGIHQMDSGSVWYNFWNTLQYDYPKCYNWCEGMPRAAPGGDAALAALIIVASLGGLIGLGYIFDIVSLKDLSQDYQRRVREFLSTHGHEELGEDTTAAKLKEILSSLSDEPQNVIALNVA